MKMKNWMYILVLVLMAIVFEVVHAINAVNQAEALWTMTHTEKENVVQTLYVIETVQEDWC